jgi:hypothetical protein
VDRVVLTMVGESRTSLVSLSKVNIERLVKLVMERLKIADYLASQENNHDSDDN